MKTLEYKDLKFNTYTNTDVNEELLVLLYDLTTNKSEVRFDFGDKDGLIDYTSYTNFTYKGQLTKTKNGYSRLYPTKRAGQTDAYAVDSIMKVFVKEGGKYKLAYESDKLQNIEYVIKEGTSPEGHPYAELFAKTDSDLRYIIGKFGINAKEELEKAIRFYKGEIHKIK